MSKRIVKVAFVLTLITLSSKLLGVIRDILMAAIYGTTIKTDAFIMAESISGVMIAIVLAALGTAFIPVMSDYLHNKTKEETNEFLNVVYTISIAFNLMICILSMIFMKSIVKLFAPSFGDEVFNLTVNLTRIIMPSVVLTVIITLNNAKLQNHGNFIIPAIVGVPFNIAMIGSMLFFTGNYGIYGLTVAFVIGTFLQIVIQYPFVRKLGYRYKVNFNLREEGTRRIGVLIIPTIIGSGIQQINTLVDRMMASGLPVGSIAALNFSNRLNLFIIGIMVAISSSIFYTTMSDYVALGRTKDFNNLLRNAMNVFTIILIPASAGFLVLRLPIVKFVFQRGMFDKRASEMTAIALVYLSLGLIGFAQRDLLSRAFYSLKDTKTPMINGAIAVIINIVLCITLVKPLGIGGLALATSASGIAASGLLIISLYKKIGDFGLVNMGLVFLKSVVASSVMAFIVSTLYKILYSGNASNTNSLFISVATGIAAYGILIKLLKIEEFEVLLHMIKNRFKRGSSNIEKLSS